MVEFSPPTRETRVRFPANALPVFVWGFPGGSDNKASACNAGDPGSIPGLGRSPGEEMAIHSSTLAWKIPWMEEPNRL